MSNSNKHRTFINEVIKVLKDMGCYLSIDENKHVKIKVANGDKKDTWVVSKSPTNRFSAQRNALSELKRTLRNLGVNDLSPLENNSLLTMIVNGYESQIDIQNIKSQLESQVDRNGLGLLSEEVEILSRIIESSLNLTQTVSHGDISILRPDGSPLSACTKFVAVPAAEKGIYHNSYTLKAGCDALLNYYQHCQGIVEMGVVVTDIWRPSNINELEIPIQIFETIGIKTIFVLTSGQSVTIIPPTWK
jgi:hypothetical protein